MLNITPIGAFSDNYIWVLHRESHAIAVDPGDAQPLLEFLTASQLTLTAVLITHHHSDHIGGLAALITRFPGLSVYGPPSISLVNKPVIEGPIAPMLGMSAWVMEVPGHTLDHLAYLIEGHLFCGDTLFGAGCGRVFEGTPQRLYQSLLTIAALPIDTLIYPAHEYTLHNLLFAQTVDPTNPVLATRRIIDQARRQRSEPTLPSTLQQELATNPFLRAEEPAVIACIQQHSGRLVTTGVDVFCKLRAWKDRFRIMQVE